MDEGNFKIKSFKYGGMGIIVVERINKDFVRRNAHMSATGYKEQIDGLVFKAADGGFLTVDAERFIVKTNM